MVNGRQLGNKIQILKEKGYSLAYDSKRSDKMSDLGYWEDVNGTHVIRTSDDFHARVYADSHGGWSGTVTNLRSHQERFSAQPYPTVEAAKEACQFVISELRRFREEGKKVQGSLKLDPPSKE
jgi:hypothetical protein